MPRTEKVVESDEEWNRCGKWILSIGKAGKFLDKVWTDLQPLLADGTLIWLKASTAVLKQKSQLHCYTGPGLSAIRRAASAIRQVVDIRGCMFYVPNELLRMETIDLIMHKSVCTYMHTYLGNFYKKDLSGRWWPDNEDDIKNFSLTSQFFRQNYSGFDPLPSKTEKTVISLGVDSGQNPDWYLLCSYLEEDDRLLPEVDRVWAVGTRLLSEGLVIGLRASRDRPLGEVRLYVDRDSDVRSQFELCDRIFKEASIRGVIYYKKRVDSESLYSKPMPQYYRRTDWLRLRNICFQERPCEEQVMGPNVKHFYMPAPQYYTQTDRRSNIRFQERPCEQEVMGSNVKHDYMQVPRYCTQTDRRRNIRCQERPYKEVMGPNLKHDSIPKPNEYKRTDKRSNFRFQEQLYEEEIMFPNVKHDYMYTSDGELYKTTKLGSVFVMSKSGSSHVPGLSAETGHISKEDGNTFTNERSCAVEDKVKDP